MTDESWARSIERELGANGARHDATDGAVARIEGSMKDGFAKQERSMEDLKRSVEGTVGRESAHIRGEIARLDALYREQRAEDEEEAEKRRREEEARNARMVADLKESAERSDAEAKRARRTNQRIIFAIVIAGVFAQTILENMPVLLRLIENLVGMAQ
jgi:hypothetical protein